MNLYTINKEYSWVLFWLVFFFVGGGGILNINVEVPFLTIICFFNLNNWNIAWCFR